MKETTPHRARTVSAVYLEERTLHVGNIEPYFLIELALAVFSGVQSTSAYGQH